MGGKIFNRGFDRGDSVERRVWIFITQEREGALDMI
jgi:hypothetical protein